MILIFDFFDKSPTQIIFEGVQFLANLSVPRQPFSFPQPSFSSPPTFVQFPANLPSVPHQPSSVPRQPSQRQVVAQGFLYATLERAGISRWPAGAGTEDTWVPMSSSISICLNQHTNCLLEFTTLHHTKMYVSVQKKAHCGAIHLFTLTNIDY